MARAISRGTHVYSRMSKGYLQPLVDIQNIATVDPDITMYQGTGKITLLHWDTIINESPV